MGKHVDESMHQRLSRVSDGGKVERWVGQRVNNLLYFIEPLNP